MYVVPAKGRKVTDPYKRDFLPEKGREIPEDSAYWRRLERDGDVVISEAAPVDPKVAVVRSQSGGE